MTLRLVFACWLCLSCSGWAGAADMHIVAGLYAKAICSGVFISGLPEETVRSEDLADFPVLPVRLDWRRHSASVGGEQRRTAVYHAGRGCTLEVPHARALVDPAPKFYTQVPESDANHPHPLPRSIAAPVQQLLADNFVESAGARRRNTRALLVLRDGTIVGEKYADGITADTRLPGYSMSKGFAVLLVGMLQRRGWLALTDTALLPNWRGATDPRRLITVNHLLRMTSGLEWSESYDGSSSDLMTMLTQATSPSRYAAGKTIVPLFRPQPGRVAPAVAPGERWRYNGGSYEIVSYVIRRAIESHGQHYQRFVYRELLYPLGMTSAELEAGPDGTYMLSAFALATASDWARLGQCILDELGSDGSGKLPRDWIRNATTPTTTAENPSGIPYGEAFWLKSLGPTVPVDSFYLAGLQGQFVVMIPSLHLVVVRLGSTPEDGDWTIRPVLAGLAG
jgi:CubicO group peptidase (beta-lactamase class C family)